MGNQDQASCGMWGLQRTQSLVDWKHKVIQVESILFLAVIKSLIGARSSHFHVLALFRGRVGKGRFIYIYIIYISSFKLLIEVLFG